MEKSFLERCKEIRKKQKLEHEESKQKPRVETKKRILKRENIRAENYVHGIELPCKVSLMQIANVVPGVRYCPKIFSADVIKFTNPGVHTSVIAVNIFESGKEVLTGGKSEQESYEVAQVLANILNSKIPDTCPKIKVGTPVLKNVVLTADLHTTIDLDGFHQAHGGMCTYSKNRFTGLKFKFIEKGYNQSAIIFETGFINLTGSRTIEHGCAFLDDLIEVIEPFCSSKLPTEYIEIWSE